jgi:hypothetical protein
VKIIKLVKKLNPIFNSMSNIIPFYWYILGHHDKDSAAYSLNYIHVIRLAQRSAPISMKFLMRTKKFLGVISSRRLLLYRESNSLIHEKIFDTVIPLNGSNVTVNIKTDNKHDTRFTLTVDTFDQGKRKEDTYEVTLNIVVSFL